MRAALALAAALLSGPALADDARLEAARAYVALPTVQQSLDETLSADGMAVTLAATLPPTVRTTQEQLEEVSEVLAAAMAPLRPRLERAMTEAAAEHFTLEEIKALTAFYQSEHGASVMRKMQPYMQSALGEIAPEMHLAQQAALPRIIRILRPATGPFSPALGGARTLPPQHGGIRTLPPAPKE